MSPELQKMLEEFLATKPESDGSWAPVGEDDTKTLRDIFEKILEEKYERDIDGDLPVNLMVIDRTRFEPMHFWAIPYTHKAENKREARKIMRYAMQGATANMQIAADQVDRLQKEMIFNGFYDDDE